MASHLEANGTHSIVWISDTVWNQNTLMSESQKSWMSETQMLKSKLACVRISAVWNTKVQISDIHCRPFWLLWAILKIASEPTPKAFVGLILTKVVFVRLIQTCYKFFPQPMSLKIISFPQPPQSLKQLLQPPLPIHPGLFANLTFFSVHIRWSQDHLSHMNDFKY